MTISDVAQWIAVDDLNLDSRNPRLGRNFHETSPSQEEILKAMQDWTLEELAVSFIESGFWSQEALVVVEDKSQLVVVEGNRRLAALKMLHRATKGRPASRKWKQIAESASAAAIKRIRTVPCVRVNSRREVQAYIGFRHVTGIKEWAPPEKAAFIAHLIEDENLSYEGVMRRIGSKTPTVRQHYIAYRLLIQMENKVPEVSIKYAEERFSVMYLSLRSTGTQRYLSINILADPKGARRPVPRSKLEALQQFALWLFGDEKREPLVKDSRQIDTFGKILGSKAAVAYLDRTKQPVFEVAARIAGGEEAEVVSHVDRAADEVEEALRAAHKLRKSHKLRSATERLGLGVMRLLDLFPDLRSEIIAERA